MFLEIKKTRQFEGVPKNLALAGIVASNYNGIFHLFKMFEILFLFFVLKIMKVMLTLLCRCVGDCMT